MHFSLTHAIQSSFWLLHVHHVPLYHQAQERPHSIRVHPQRDDASTPGSPSSAAEAHLRAFNAAKFEVCRRARHECGSSDCWNHRYCDAVCVAGISPWHMQPQIPVCQSGAMPLKESCLASSGSSVLAALHHSTAQLCPQDCEQPCTHWLHQPCCSPEAPHTQTTTQHSNTACACGSRQQCASCISTAL